MDRRKIVLDQIRHSPTSVVPYTLPFDAEVGLLIDKHYNSTSWREAIEPFILGVSAVDTDPKTPIDNIYFKDGFGGIWRQDKRPWHLEKPPLNTPSFSGYSFPKPELFFRPEQKKQAQQVCAANPNSFIIGNLGWGLFERSWNLRGFETVLTDMVLEPEFYAEMLDRLMELYLQFVDYTADLPIDGILFGDDWGDQRGVIIGADRWREFLKPRWAQIFKRVHDHGKITMCHSCGSVAEIIPDLIEIGLDVLESVQPEAANMSPYQLKHEWGNKIAFWGGLGSQSTIPLGTPKDIFFEVKRLKKEMSVNGGYILAPAKPLQPGTPAVNAAACVEAFTGYSPKH